MIPSIERAMNSGHKSSSVDDFEIPHSQRMMDFKSASRYDVPQHRPDVSHDVQLAWCFKYFPKICDKRKRHNAAMQSASESYSGIYASQWQLLPNAAAGGLVENRSERSICYDIPDAA